MSMYRAAGAVIAVQAAITYLLHRRLVRVALQRGKPAADAYADGHDAGYDLGWRDHRESPGLSVIELRDYIPRPGA